MSVTQLNTCKNVPDHTMNTKSSNFEGKKRAEFQTKSIEKLKSPFYPGDLVTRTGEWESGRSAPNPGELGCICIRNILFNSNRIGMAAVVSVCDRMTSG